MGNEENQNQELSDIRAIAEKCFAFIRMVVAPLISIGIMSLVGGCWQVHDMGELNAKLESMNEKMLRMFYGGGWDRREAAGRPLKEATQ